MKLLILLLVFAGMSMSAGAQTELRIQWWQAGYSRTCAGAEYSADGERIYTFTSMFEGEETVREIEIWDRAEGRLIESFPVNAYLQRISLSADESYMIGMESPLAGPTIRVFDLKNKTFLRDDRPDKAEMFSYVWEFSFLPEGSSYALIIASTQQVEVIDAASGLQEYTFPIGEDKIKTLAFSRDGGRIAIAYETGDVAVWNVLTGNRDELVELPAPPEAVAISNDGLSLAYYSGKVDDPRKIKYRNLATDEVVFEWETQIVRYPGLKFSDNAQFLLIDGARNAAIEIRNTETPNIRRNINNYFNSGTANFAPDNNEIAGADKRGALQSWEAKSGKGLRSYAQKELDKHNGAANVVRIAPNGDFIASAGDDGTIKFWDMATGALRHSIEAHGSSIRALDIGPFSRHVASGSTTPESMLHLWDVEQNYSKGGSVADFQTITALQYSPDFRNLVVCDYSGTVGLTGSGGGVVSALDDQWYSVNSIAFSPDGRKIIAGSRDRTVKVWVKGGLFNPWMLEREFKADLSTNDARPGIQTVGFSRDGTIIITGGGEYAVRLWNADTYEQLGHYPLPQGDHRGAINSAHLLHNNSKLLTAGVDGILRIFDVASGAVLQRFDSVFQRSLNPIQRVEINSAALSMDERSVALAASDGSVVLLELGQGSSTDVGETDAAEELTLRISPNPAYRTLILRLPEAGSDSFESLSVFSALGRKVADYSHDVRATASRTLTISIDNLPPGAYLLQWSSGARHAAASLVVGK